MLRRSPRITSLSAGRSRAVSTAPAGITRPPGPLRRVLNGPAFFSPPVIGRVCTGRVGAAGVAVVNGRVGRSAGAPGAGCSPGGASRVAPLPQNLNPAGLAHPQVAQIVHYPGRDHPL